jgi:hypothetical protein
MWSDEPDAAIKAAAGFAGVNGTEGRISGSLEGGFDLRLAEMTRVLVVGAVGFFALVGVNVARNVGVVEAQDSQIQDIPRPSSSHDPNTPALGAGLPDGGIHARMNDERIKLLNDSRHERLQDDVAKLVALTTELKTDVDKTNKDELSLDVVKKAGEIEKLAHDVQSRMKN